jgi:hypothetical protein
MDYFVVFSLLWDIVQVQSESKTVWKMQLAEFNVTSMDYEDFFTFLRD